MFDKTSRYYKINIATMTMLDSDGLTTLVEHSVTQGERLDTITARYLGDPTQFWRVCDANDVLQPTELTEEVGNIIKIAMPHL